MSLRFRPSSAHRWVNCPGSVQAEQNYPDTESDAAKEGTAAHWLAEQVLIIHKHNAHGLLSPSVFLNRTAPNGVVIDSEMIEGVNLYIDDVFSKCHRLGMFGLIEIEKEVKIEPDNYGTPDLHLIYPDSSKLILWDFKYGRSPVEVFENWQLLNYASGLSSEGEIELRIVQPRAYHSLGPCRSWTITAEELNKYRRVLSNAIVDGKIDNPPTMAGKWCKWCKAAADCSTLQRECAEITDTIQELNLLDLTPEQSSIELSYLRKSKVLIEERLNGLEAKTTEDIRSGINVPGYKLEHGRGSTKWNKPDDEVIALGDTLGVNLRKPESPITPAQASKLNVDKTVINAYSEKYPGQTKLVTDENTLAAMIFKSTN